jgi:DNA-binding winged helix-turn-helix (wHTH) protein/Tfp pilus assembly protein PilF
VSAAIYTFGVFEIDGHARQLRRDGQRVQLSDRYLSVLLHLAAHAEAVVPKDELMTAAWGDIAVGDNSLEQAISALRRALGSNLEGHLYVETVPRQGYRLATPVARIAPRASDDALEALLAPHRALLDGRAALETLEGGEILRAREVFTHVVATTPDAAAAHIGLANACVLQFEMTRADETPDGQALELATRHAYEACRLDTQHGEAWGTLSFVLERIGRHTDALAAGRRAITLEPDNWRHHFRLASIAWGEERLRAARRTLALLPGFALAHWLAATVLVARGMLDDAARELTAGIAGEGRGNAGSRFSGVALHWLFGLICLARGDQLQALEEFERELMNEASGHLYGRECCANTWYAIGALRLRQGDMAAAATAFGQALERVPKHPMARLGKAVADGSFDPASVPMSSKAPHPDQSIEAVLCTAAQYVLRGSHDTAAQLVHHALSSAVPSNAAWLLPIEPLLNVGSAPGEWESALIQLQARTA